MRCYFCGAPATKRIETNNEIDETIYVRSCDDCAKPYQWLIDELQDMIDFNTKHGIDNSKLLLLLEKTKEKQGVALDSK